MVRGKVVVIAVSILLLGIGLRLWLERGPARPPATVSRPSTEVTKASPETRPGPPQPQTPRPIPFNREELEILSRGPWGRNPFLTPEEEAPLGDPARLPVGAPPGFAPLEVRAILVSEERRIAMIDGHMVAEGDLIGEERVLEIRPHAVVLSKGKRTRTIEIEFPAIPVRSTAVPMTQGGRSGGGKSSR